MSRTILPSGEELKVVPEEILRYLDPDGLRQLLRQERLRWHLKVNKDVDYIDPTRLFKYAAEVHNEGFYQRMEIHTFADNGASAGYAGINVDSGVYGFLHNVEKWDKSISEESKKNIVNRVTLGALAKIKGKSGYGLDENEDMSDSTENRMAMMLFDPFDGRVYLLSNDEPTYVNNETRSNKIPERSVARICDIPTRITHLVNDLNFISDPDYKHTDNNFSHSNRFIVDNLDDRTFVYPEISKDKEGKYIENQFTGLNGLPSYGESDGGKKQNTQTDAGSTRQGEAVNSYNQNVNFSSVYHSEGFVPGVFRSLEELEKVDLVGQKQTTRTNSQTPGARRPNNYYIMDGRWSPNWFDRITYKDSYLAMALNPNNMEVAIEGYEPVPYMDLSQTDEFDRSQLYQWRYNRIDIVYPSSEIEIYLVSSGQGYQVGDILRWTFGDDSFEYEVTNVGSNGQIQSGHYISKNDNVYDQDPSTNGIGVEFINTSSTGYGAKLAIKSKGIVTNCATQLKNNLYAYVDVVPTIASDNSTRWSDNKLTDSQGGKIGIRSTAAGPAYSGVNSGRGGPSPSENTSGTSLYEHGGNATAGAHVHLFRYVINTENPTWVIQDGVQVFTGKWVDQGPMGVERPGDIKALLFSNGDTNNFNNYYKFMMDLLMDGMNRNPDAVSTNNPNAVCTPYLHIDQVDPTPDRRFTDIRIDPDTSEVIEVDITWRVLYINAATGVMFVYNTSYKNDPSFGYGFRAPGWVAISGVTSR